MAFELRLRMRNARRIVPHVLEMSNRPAMCGNDVVQVAIAIGVRTVEEVRRRIPPVPVLADLLQVPVDTAGSNDRLITQELTLFPGGLDYTLAPGNATAILDQFTDSAAEHELQLAGIRVRRYQVDESLDKPESRAPHDVVAGYAIAWHIVAALNPVNSRHESHALLTQPVEDSLGALLDVGFSPAFWPGIVIRKLGKGLPVRQCQFGCVPDAHTFLYWRSHQRHTAKCGSREAPDVLFRVPIDNRHRLALLQAFVRCDQACNTCTDDNYVASMANHTVFPHLNSGVYMS